MVEKEQVAVVVPTYKTILSQTEQISHLQLLSVFGQYDIIYVVPQRLQADYLDKASVERFTDIFFEDVEGYNRLMLSKEFYQRFVKYKYILIYQLDAFAFENRLLEFCNLGYDYIGAPWLSGMRKRVDDTYIFANVGNGGFSLRNVRSTIQLLKTKEAEVKDYSNNEDLFYAFHNCSEFRVAPISIALEFAIERQVRECFKLNKCRLPFGCHAWERYDFEFWKPFIEKEGHRLPIKELDSGMEDRINQDEYTTNSLFQKFWTYDEKINLKNTENKKIAIFGAGMYGKRVLEILQNSGVTIEGFIDNNVAIQNSFIRNYAVHGPKILENGDQYFVIIALAGYNLLPVKEQLENMGKIYQNDFILYKDLFS